MLVKALGVAAGWLFDNPLGKLAASAAGLLALVVAFAWDQRSIGGDRAIAKVHRQEAAANDAADRAAAKSGAGGLQSGQPVRRRGIRDPSTRDQ